MAEEQSSPGMMLPGGQVVPKPGGETTMVVRFFNGDGPLGEPRLLIAVSFEEEQAGTLSGQMREAVRVATEDDVKTHETEYQQYLAQFPAVASASAEA